MNENNTEITWEAVQFAFMEEWEAGETTGTRPTLGEYIEQYPRYALELTDFVLGFVALTRTDAAFDYNTPLSPEAERAGNRVRETLGLGEYAVAPEPEPNFADLMREAGVNVVKLKNALGVPPLLVNRMQNGLLSDWSGALLRRVGDALNRTADEVAAALSQSFRTGGSLAAAHFKATGGDPDEKAAQGTPRTLAETLDELEMSDSDKAHWLSSE
ncbi:MAG: hypothetical protein H7Y38_06355 [Armatimonadetes bacterium]|nr:hypothetical protein [Armatimonadota bacterium]